MAADNNETTPLLSSRGSPGHRILEIHSEAYPATGGILLPCPGASCLCRLAKRHRRLSTVLAALLLILIFNGWAVYEVHFRNRIRLKVLAYNVWGLPGGIGGAVDKEERIAAISDQIRQQSLGATGEDFDMVLLEELWMQADHDHIAANLPEGFHMTAFRELSSPLCDGRVLVTTCSGLSVISRFPFLETEFHMYTYRGSIWDGEALAGKGVGRVRVQPHPDVTVDVFVTHTIADGNTLGLYNNTDVRIRQVTELMDDYVDKSDADVVVLGGDFNTPPTRGDPGSPYGIITSRGMINSVEEIFSFLERWLSEDFSTYANPRNTFSARLMAPITYDYIFRRSRSGNDMLFCWTSWFELPLFVTKIVLKAIAGRSGNNQPSETTISLSDHEPVFSTMYIKRWNATWPYL